MDYTEMQFQNLPVEKREILIAMLSDLGFTGFEEEQETFKAYIPTQNFEQDSFEIIIQQVGVNYSKSLIKEINWNEKWEKEFQPVSILHAKTSKAFAYLRADFHPPDTTHLYDIIVTPKMSFGTGHHPTTYLMVSLMATMDFVGKSVLDFGTGTGILAILAEKMGAAKITALDCDDWSINNARENFAKNGCTEIDLIKTATIPEKGSYDIVLANINLNVLIENMAIIKKVAISSGFILLSGIMVNDEEKIKSAIENSGMIVKDISIKENWLAVSVRQK